MIERYEVGHPDTGVLESFTKKTDAFNFSMSHVQIGPALFICGDSLSIDDVPSWDAVVTDPPYFLRKELKRAWHGGNGRTRLHGDNAWDEFSEGIEKHVLSLSEAEQAIIWGGNFHALPPTDTWVIWDKLQDNRGSDAELAWARLKKRGCRVFRMSRIDAYFNKRIFPKVHPTEKPIQLMEFCVSKTTGVVFDPFMGVGSTGLACLRLGRSFIGIEKDASYFEEAVRRAHIIWQEKAERDPERP